MTFEKCELLGRSKQTSLELEQILNQLHEQSLYTFTIPIKESVEGPFSEIDCAYTISELLDRAKALRS